MLDLFKHLYGTAIVAFAVLIPTCCTAWGEAANLTVEQLADALRARTDSVQNGVAEFHRYIHIPEKEKAVSRVTRRGPDGQIIEEHINQDQPEGRFTTRHKLTFSGSDLVRNESYTITSEDTGQYELYDITVDWGDQRRHTSTDPEQYIMIRRGEPDRRSYEPIGNAGTLLSTLDVATKLNGSDSVDLEMVDIDGEAMIRIGFSYDRDGGQGLEVEALIDPARDFLVRSHSQWIPTREAPTFERTATYDDPVQNASGVWYPTLVEESTFGFLTVGTELQKFNHKTMQFNVLSYETNIVDLDIKTLFDRSLPPNRKVMDYILDPENGKIYDSSQDGQLDAFLASQMQTAGEKSPNEIAVASVDSGSAPIDGLSSSDLEYSSDEANKTVGVFWPTIMSLFAVCTAGLAITMFLRKKKAGGHG